MCLVGVIRRSWKEKLSQKEKKETDGLVDLAWIVVFV